MTKDPQTWIALRCVSYVACRAGGIPAPLLFLTRINPTVLLPEVPMRLAPLVLATILSSLSVVALAATRPECHDEGRFRVIAKPTESVGTDFLVKQLGRGRSIPPCKYLVREGDFEIRNENAEYFLGMAGSFLVLDSGTAPEPRGLVIWDLQKRQKVFTGSYSKPVSIDESGITFWQPGGEATDANCPQAAGWRAQGLGAALETEVRLGFADMKPVAGAATRCAARQ